MNKPELQVMLILAAFIGAILGALISGGGVAAVGFGIGISYAFANLLGKYIVGPII